MTVNETATMTVNETATMTVSLLRQEQTHMYSTSSHH
jgi:hypothetical protein